MNGYLALSKQVKMLWKNPLDACWWSANRFKIQKERMNHENDPVRGVSRFLRPGETITKFKLLVRLPNGSFSSFWLPESPGFSIDPAQ